MGMLDYYRDKNTIKNIILKLAAKDKQVVYGAQSVNIQLPEQYNKETKDYDILTANSKGAAENLAKELNKEYGSDKFVVTPAIHKGTFKVKDIDGTPIADYTQTTNKPKSVGNLGIRYATLAYQKRNIRKSLKNPEAAFRKEKDLDALSRIRKGTRKWLSAGWKR